MMMEACCAYVLMVTAVYWVSEAVPLGAAALVAAEYCKDTTLLLMGVICLAASIEKWNLHKRIALRMVMVAGAKPGINTFHHGDGDAHRRGRAAALICTGRPEDPAEDPDDDIGTGEGGGLLSAE
ncbi:hypothetical protein CRUP_037148 [Coryphaenoides rupestris]|nr:hypothetical protein CRUP_037148 [Coryphaenoides rupestris]